MAARFTTSGSPMSRNTAASLLALCLLATAGCAETAADDERRAPMPEDLSIVAAEILWQQVDAGDLPDVEDFRLVRAASDETGRTHVRAQQLLGGVPIEGAEAIVHIGPDGTVEGVTDDLRGSPVLSTVPELTDESATDIARGEAAETMSPSGASLAIIHIGGEPHLVWQVRLSNLAAGGPLSEPTISVDAHTGEVIRVRETLATESTHVHGQGHHSGEVVLTARQGEEAVSLLDEDRGFVSLDFEGTETEYSIPRAPDHSFNASDDAEAVDGHFGVTSALDFYAQLGRDGIDGEGGPRLDGWVFFSDAPLMPVVSRYGDAWNNAAWSSDGIIVLGSGDGVNLAPLTTLDIVGHEVTHGVVQHTAGLEYCGESGALNESYADIMGAMIERSRDGDGDDVWMIGEEAWTPGVDGDALRYMNDPSIDGYSRDHYDDRMVYPSCTDENDQGGVHGNSGIQNLAFYLLVSGGSHPTEGDLPAMDGIGAEDATRVALDSLNYLTSTSDMHDAMRAWKAAADARFGADSGESQRVTQAWARVGVTE